MGENVWGGGPKFNARWLPANGWTTCINFSSLGNLVEQMKDKKITPGGVDRLGIVAHGDAAGLVQLTGKYIPGAKDLTVANRQYYAKDLQKLKSYLAPSGWLIFFSCVAARGRAGDKLLGMLSRVLPGRTIVGFTTFGFVPVHPLMVNPLAAGDVYVAGFDRSSNPAHYKGKPRQTIWTASAKWAKNGYIIRQPADELKAYQKRLPDKRCGSVFCLGHARFGDVCTPYKRHPERDFFHAFGFRPMPIPEGAYFQPSQGGPKRKPGPVR